MLATLAVVAVLVEGASWQSADSARSASTDELVRQLGAFRAALPASGPSDGSVDAVEQRRQDLYAQLTALWPNTMPSLAHGLKESDVQVRRNAALYLLVSGGMYWPPKDARLDIRPLLPDLMSALSDDDARVRELSAQAIGVMGPAAAVAVPALIALLQKSDVGSRNTACIGLAAIGPAAREALPTLRRALSDPSNDVRRFAQRAIEMIDVG